MTEEEAKTKWCPAVRLIQVQCGPEAFAVVNNRVSAEELRSPGARESLAAHCIGSACMAWRWTKKAYFDEYKRPISSADRASSEKGILGFCGLAGKP